MAVAPFKVKAIYAYNSGHDDDLKFPEAQIITVTEEEDADWYVGEYVDASGESQSGLFPKNFVERYEPAPPPRPIRGARKPAEAPVTDTPKAVASPQIPAASEFRPEEPAPSKPAVQATPPTPSEEFNASRAPAPTSPEVSEPPPAPKPAQATPAKKPPPPVAGKSNSIMSKIGMFNNPSAAPVVPFKPGGAGSSSYIKKPYVAPPPSRDAYVAPTQQQPPPRIYRREEDPEIAQRKAEDEAAAEKAGLAPGTETEGQEEEGPKLSLKERIAALQKSQMETASRRADTAQKEKPKRPPKKRTESHDPDEGVGRDSIDTEGGERPMRGSSDIPREPARHQSKGPKSPTAAPREIFNDDNDADHSAAGETTEDADRDSTTEEEGNIQRHEKAPTVQPEVGDEEDETEEEEEELDEETKRKMELRARMARIGGGMSMGGMLGMAPMPALPKRNKPSLERRPTNEAESVSSPPQRVAVLPGMMPPRTMSQESDMTVGKEEEELPFTSQRSPDDVPDVEDIVPVSPPRTRTERAVPPPPTTDRGVPPPVPGGRPSTDSRPVPQAPIQSPSPGSESDDEMPPSSRGEELPIRAAPPPIPHRDEPRSPPRSSMDREPTSPISPSRSQRITPSMSSPTMAPSTAQSRPPPPPPPTQAPPSRQDTSHSSHKRAAGAGVEGESEYEGDYDTDITSNAKHKDALKVHARDSSFDDSMIVEDSPTRSPPLPGTSALRAMPPVPPTQAPQTSRKSTETPRAAPPPVPSRGMDDDDDYDPYKYTPGGSAAAPRSPPSAPRQAPRPPSLPAMPAPPPVPASYQPEPDESEEEDLHANPPPRRSTDQARKSTDRAPPPLPPQAPPQHDRAPPPLPPQAPPSQYAATPPPAPSGKAPMRASIEQERSKMQPSRKSTDPQFGRASTSGQRPESGDYIARDIDLAEASQWWAQSDTPPPLFRGRPDVLYEVEESTTSMRGGSSVVSKTVFLLFQDYSQTVITAQFDPRNVDDVSLEQRHEGPPSKLRQDELEGFWTRFGSAASKNVQTATGSSAVGDGSAYSLVLELLRPMKGALPPVGTRAFGALVYANLGNATVQQFDEIRPGDIVSFRNAKFSGKHGGLHTKYSLELATHVGIVIEWDGTKKKLRAAEQGKDGHGEAVEGGKPSKEKSSKKKGKVEVESYRLGDLRSGEVRVWRIVGRGYVGWNEGQ